MDDDIEKIGDMLVEVVSDVRKAKSDKQVSLKTPVKRLLVRSKLSKSQFDKIITDLTAVTSSEKIEYEQLDEKSKIDVETVIDI